MMPTFKLEESCTVKCHLCGLKVTFGMVQGGRGTMLHELPYCQAFKEADSADEMIAYMRRCKPLHEN